MRKLGNSNTLYFIMRNPVGGLLEGLTSDETKNSDEWIIFILENDDAT